jgi:hypothetical protein
MNIQYLPYCVNPVLTVGFVSNLKIIEPSWGIRKLSENRR